MPEPIEVKPRTLNTLLNDIDNGLLKIPRFQREVVWELADSVQLLDSIYRGLGDLQLPAPATGQMPSYVLDGQQRLTSIYACAREARVSSRKRKNPVQYIAWFDLEKKCFASIKPDNAVTFKQLIATNYDEYRDPLVPAFRAVFSETRKILLEDYRFSTVVVRERSMEDACIIFERINNSGKKLMQALSLYSVKLDPEKSTSGQGDRYGCHKRHLLALDPIAIKSQWPTIKECVKLAIDFLVNHIGVPTSKLIPYEAPIALYTLFYLLNNKYSPNEKQACHLARYFWCCSISGRYAGSPESSMEEDAMSVRAIHNGTFNGWAWAKSINSDTILRARYDRRDAMVQTILCLLASKCPLSFKSNTPIPVAKEFSQFNATELHHVFPRGWLKKTGNHEWLEQEHSLANICLSPSREQRHEIGANPPSKYLGMFRESNARIDQSLVSHIMGDGMVTMLETDRFMDFIVKRADAMAAMLNHSAGVV